MQAYHKALLSVVVGVLCVALLLLYVKTKEWEESKLLIEDYPPAGYSDHYPDGIRRYGFLEAHGDYTKLKLIIRSEKKDYGPGDPVEITFFVRNDSDGRVHLGPGLGELHYTHFWKLFHSNSEEVLKTPKGEIEFQSQPGIPHSDRIQNSTGGRIYPQLQPGQEFRITQIRLNIYFDLSKPDTYELTCFLKKFIDGQYYEPPLQSNTLTFRILEDGEKAENAEEGINPPEGEEVFKQPKPPKNVFYAYDQTSRLIFIDESPATYYHQRRVQELRKRQKATWE